MRRPIVLVAMACLLMFPFEASSAAPPREVRTRPEDLHMVSARPRPDMLNVTIPQNISNGTPIKVCIWLMNEETTTQTFRYSMWAYTEYNNADTAEEVAGFS
jgi:hypothetical protein